MSRIGKKPVPIPSGVTVTVDGSTVKVKGPKGELSRTFDPAIKIRVEGNEVLLDRPGDEKRDRALHGLTRALIANMVTGVTEGFKKTLEIVGVGYKAEKKGKNLVVTVGYSHPVNYPEPSGITLTTPAPTTILSTVSCWITTASLRPFDDFEDPPALRLRQRARLYDLDDIAFPRRILFILRVILLGPLELLAVERVRDFALHRDYRRFVHLAAHDGADTRLARASFFRLVCHITCLPSRARAGSCACAPHLCEGS